MFINTDVDKVVKVEFAVFVVFVVIGNWTTAKGGGVFFISNFPYICGINGQKRVLKWLALWTAT